MQKSNTSNSSEDRVVFSRAQAVVLLVMILLSMVLLILTGCTTQGKPEGEEPGQVHISSKPQEQTEFVKLYFSDPEAMYLQSEVREVTFQGETLAEIVIKELINGPNTEGLMPTIPPDAKLISFQVTDGVGFVNFSKELQTKHWGGTAGEIMTIYSVTNTLADLRIGINKVQFLVEGQKQETLTGHIETFDPIKPDWTLNIPGEIRLGTLTVNQDRMIEVQEEVNNGNSLWYLDPVQVAMETGTRLGFDPRQDIFTLEEEPQEGVANVKVNHAGSQYIIQLVQPVEQGESGVWAVNLVRTPR